MNDDRFADAGRGIARKNERVLGTHANTRKTVERAASLAAHWLVSLVAVLAVAWVVVFVVPAFSGLLAATIIGFGLVALVPWAVITGVVRVLEATEHRR